MNEIPKPCDEQLVPDDLSVQYLQRWKELFNSIDSENIRAYSKGDGEFPESSSGFEMNSSRLSDYYNTDVQLFIELRGRHLADSYYGNEIYCCLGNTSFASGWIYESDPNFDSLQEEPISWEEMYMRLVTKTTNYQSRIPIPCTV